MSHDDDNDSPLAVRDSNGTLLADGDTVVVTKDLKVKGSPVPLKRGTVIKHIKLRDGAEAVEGNTDKIKGLMIRPEYLRKA
jgi:protein PhnA